MLDIILAWFDGFNNRMKEFKTIEEAEEYRIKHVLEMLNPTIYKRVNK